MENTAKMVNNGNGMAGALLDFDQIKQRAADEQEIRLTVGELRGLLDELNAAKAKRNTGRKQSATTSLYKKDGVRKASAAEPFRNAMDFAAMAQYLGSHGTYRQRNYMLIVLGTTLGLRVGDLMSIRVRDVVDKDGAVRPYLELIEEKTGKRSKNVITPKAAAAIEDYLANTEYRLDDPLFCSRKRQGGEKRALDKTQVWKILNEAARALGLEENVGTHSMRKTYGYSANAAMLDAGMSAAQAMEVLQEKYRHSSQTVTMRYLGLAQKNIDAVAAAVDNWLGGNEQGQEA